MVAVLRNPMSQQALYPEEEGSHTSDSSNTVMLMRQALECDREGRQVTSHAVGLFIFFCLAFPT